MEMNTRGRIEFQVRDREVRNFLYTRSGIVKEEQQGAIAASASSSGGQPGKQSAQFVTIQEAGFVKRSSFGRNRGNSLRHRHHLGHARGGVLKEAVQGGQPLIASANLIAALRFQIAQKVGHALKSQIGQREARDLASGIVSGEDQEQPQRVAIALIESGRSPFCVLRWSST